MDIFVTVAWVALWFVVIILAFADEMAHARPSDPFDKLNGQGFRDTIEAADDRYHALYDRYQELRAAVELLRATQRVYMLKRGNEELGRAVGAAAARVDALLVSHAALVPKRPQ